MDGVLLIDKATGPTSFDVVRKVRKRTQVRRVGHAGTLDPLASGLLVVCVGQGTKLVPYLMDGDKRYRVTIALGEETDTLDSDGEILRRMPVPAIDREEVATVASRFVGTIAQVPPLYSAIKKGGEALYKKARRGETVALEPRQVRIDAIDVTGVAPTRIDLDVRCGKGTYIRSLARDIALALGTVGHVCLLRREATSGFQVSEALPQSVLDDPDWAPSDHVISLADALPSLPQVVVDEGDAKAIGFGQTIAVNALADVLDAVGTNVALVDGRQRLLAIAEILENGLAKPVRGFPVTE